VSDTVQDGERDHNMLGLAMLHGIVDSFLHHTIQMYGYGMIDNVDGVIAADLAREVKECLHTGRQFLQAKTRPYVSRVTGAKPRASLRACSMAWFTRRQSALPRRLPQYGTL